MAITTVIPVFSSFRRKPESRGYGHNHRHSSFSSFRRKPESMECGQMHRHSSSSSSHHCGASQNLRRVFICTVIAAQAGIYGVWSYAPSFRLPQPSFRRKPESMACSHTHRHCGASRNLWSAVILTVIPAPPVVIPAQAGIYALRWTPVFAGMTGPYLNHPKRNTARAGGG